MVSSMSANLNLLVTPKIYLLGIYGIVLNESCQGFESSKFLCIILDKEDALRKNVAARQYHEEERVSTRHVILALLEIEPMNGYDLAQNIKLSVDSLWAATYGQIYPMLHKLEEEGLLTSESQVRGQHMQRVVYTITSSGRMELAHWLEQPIQYLPFRDPFKLWASYIDAIPPQAVFRNIAEHIRMHTQRAETLERIARSIEQGIHPLTKVRQEHLPKEKVERLKRARSLIYYELASQARFEVESARRIWELATELYPDDIPDSLGSQV